MNTKRCELCGKLYENSANGCVSVSFTEDGTGRHYDCYNVCDDCSTKAFTLFEELKKGVFNKKDELESASNSLIVKQNEKINALRNFIRTIQIELIGAIKSDTQDITLGKLIDKIERSDAFTLD